MIDFIREHRTVILKVLAAVGLFISFIVFRRLGVAERGNRAIGGEVLIFLLPYVLVTIRNSISDMFNRHK